MREITIKSEHLQELSVRTQMVEFEYQVVESMARMIQHEEEIERQLSQLVFHLKKAGLHEDYHDEYKARLTLLQENRKALSKAKKDLEIRKLRLEALREAMMFYLRDEYGIALGEPCTLSIEDEKLYVGAREIAPTL